LETNKSCVFSDDCCNPWPSSSMHGRGREFESHQVHHLKSVSCGAPGLLFSGALVHFWNFCSLYRHSRRPALSTVNSDRLHAASRSASLSVDSIVISSEPCRATARNVRVRRAGTSANTTHVRTGACTVARLSIANLRKRVLASTIQRGIPLFAPDRGRPAEQPIANLVRLRMNIGGAVERALPHY